MYPRLYNSSNELKAVLNNIIADSARIKRVINGEFTFSFSALEQELKSEYFEENNNILIKDQRFDIKYIEQTHRDGVTYDIQCEHITYRMEDGTENLFDTYAYVGTPSEILGNILSGTDFSVGTVDFTDVITLAVPEEVTRKALIKTLANYLGGEIEYTNEGYTVSILDTIGQNNGYEIRFGKNLKGVTKIVDDRGNLKTYYRVDSVMLKNSTTYKEKNLGDLEVVEIGDTVRIYDEVINLDVLNRIISIEENPIFEVSTILEIANTIELITDRITDIETSTVYKGKSYNNASISNDYGFRATLDDQTARTTFGGGTISMDVGDGIGNYTKAMYFDVLTGKYKFIGDIEATGTITGADFIGGTINIGDGEFTVDSLGNVISNSLTANDAIISGAITITSGSGVSNLSDSGVLATLDDIDSTYVTDAGALITKDGVDFNIPGEILNAGVLAVADYVDMSTGDVINKIADNIQETITRKWAAETGADVTGNNTAASILNQGDLATLDDITLSRVTDSGLLAALNSIGSTYIDDNAVITPKLAAGAVVASKISVSDLSAISADIGSITTGSLTGVNISANTFEAEDYVYINTNTYNEGLYLQGFGTMYFRVYDPGGTVEVGPNLRVPGTIFSGANQVVDTAGNGLDKSGSTLDIDPSEIAGTGLQEDLSSNLEIDDTVVVTSTSGQNIRLQVFAGSLEFSLNGGPFTKLQNA